MKKLLLTFFMIVLVISLHAQNDSYSPRWRRVYGYEMKDLPKSAVAVVDTIYRRAKSEGNIQQFTKALLYQAKFALTLENDAELVIIRRFTNEISTASAPQRNILESMLAKIYWDYFKINRHRYYDRTHTTEVQDTDDFRLWDARTMKAEIDKHFLNSLKDPAILQNTRIESISELLAEAENSRLYRPTLYDLIAHIALDFYSLNEDFEKLRPSPVKAIEIYGSLSAFHKSARDTSAYINVEIDRIEYLDNEKLISFIELKRVYSNHPASAAIDYEIASILNEQNKKVEALDLCNNAIEKFPSSYGAKRCEDLRNTILAPELSLQTENGVPVNTPFLARAQFHNVSKIILTAYRIDEAFYLHYNDALKDSAFLEEISKLTQQIEFAVDLQTPKDYQSHSTEFKIPGLPSGRYLLFARSIDRNGELLPGYDHAVMQVSNFALLQTRTETGIRIHIVDRTNGQPLSNVRVRLKTGVKNTQPVFDRAYVTNDEGYFEFESSNSYYGIDAFVSYRDDSYVAEGIYLQAGYEEYNPDGYNARAVLFTDRSIYRPGQTVYFKGILLKVKGNRSSLVSGEYVEVSLLNVNDKEVGVIRLKSNSFGSFSGEFKLPSSGLTGEYTLRVDEDFEEDSKFYDDLFSFGDSEVAISVEEYKRPTFEVSFKPVTETYVVNDTISVTGNAISFSGSKLIKAKVKYRVVRRSNYQFWMYRGRSVYPGKEDEIIDSTTVTNDKGEFKVSFIAKPDNAFDKNGLPVFTYSIAADVTDINGETRSSTEEVNAGYLSMIATVSILPEIDRNIKTQAIGITTENLNNEFVPAKGRVRIYKLDGPTLTVRRRPWDAPEYHIMSEEEFHREFPFEAYKNESDRTNWKNGKLWADLAFDTNKSKELKLSIDRTWDIGAYAIELATTDPDGREVTDRREFTVIDPRGTVVPDKQLLIFETDKGSYKPGETMRVKVGSAAKDVTLMIVIENDGKVIESRTERFSNSATEIDLVVPSSEYNELHLSCSGVAYNAFIQSTKDVSIVSSSRLDIETISFRDKLKPGGKETWSFEVRNDNDGRKEAEVLASMYDASLDMFKPHTWDFTLYGDSRGRVTNTTPGWCFRVERFRGYRPPRVVNRTFPQQYDQLDWYGFTINKNEYIARQYRERLYADPTLTKPSQVSMKNSRHRPAGFVFGTIRDALGEAIPGTNILVKGTTRGTASDLEGNYEIEVGKGDTLVFSFIGYSTAETVVRNKNTINVMLELDVTQLEEVVVVGYGTQMKKSLTGSISTIVDYDEDKVFMMLAGRADGVQVRYRLGGGGRISVREMSVEEQENTLYVVDGVPVTSYTVDEDDIASVEALSGNEAVKIYGSKAAYGVIIVNTKSGQARLDAEMAKVNARKNFNETAFFFPHLTTDENGKIRFSFTTPESLTRWKLQLLAHNQSLSVGTKTLFSVTQKDLMVTPNMPRVLRTGDEITLSVKISNLTSKSSSGNALLQLTDPMTGTAIDAKLANSMRNKPFKLLSKGNAEVSWVLKVPEGLDVVQYRVVAKAGSFSDGEQNVLPVLSNRIMITETIPMYVRGGQSKTFSMTNLVNLKSTTLTHHRLTLEVTSNPAWYALQSLPYLMEFPHECAEQMFSRYYANALGSYIVDSNPKLAAMFEKWKADGVLTSDLETNASLKSILIEETPWLRDAESESEQKKRIALLFDTYATQIQKDAVISRLTAMQLSNGGFPWFAGATYASRYITQHIASGYGHLAKLKAADKNPPDVIKRAIAFLDNEIEEDYLEAIKDPSRRYLNEAIHYLYMRSFFPELPVDEGLKKAMDFYADRTQTHWADFNLYLRSMIALIHHRRGNTTFAADILKSIKENSMNSDELGMYWKENVPGWYWYESPIETQALVIEAFSEIKPVNEDIDAMRTWLLKNKQTTQWKTTRATTEAVYALLLNGTSWISEDAPVQATIGDKPLSVSRSDMEAGTGTFKKIWMPENITTSLGIVTLEKTDKGVAWGGLYWQYFENIDNVVPAATPLKLDKKVFLVTHTENGELMNEVVDTTALRTGDLLRIRIRLSVDRDMEFLHMKDQRASGTEPVDVLSEYKWKDELGFYQSTKDAATHFFFDVIKPGVYVFEYDVRVNNKGNFSNGIATIESMYAPEFTSHSGSIRLKVK